jgi:hypothetical protein
MPPGGYPASSSVSLWPTQPVSSRHYPDSTTVPPGATWPVALCHQGVVSQCHSTTRGYSACISATRGYPASSTVSPGGNQSVRLCHQGATQLVAHCHYGPPSHYHSRSRSYPASSTVLPGVIQTVPQSHQGLPGQ